MTTAIFNDSSVSGITTRYLDGTWTRDVRSLLYHTYRDDPAFMDILESGRIGYDQRIRACTRELASNYFTENMPVIGVLDGDRLIGVAFVTSGQSIGETVSRLLWKWKMILTIGYRCTCNYIDYLYKLQHKLPGGSCYFLPMIGIHPEFRKAGHSRTLLSAVHDLCDLDQNITGCALTLSQKEMLPFFQALGYRETGKLEEGGYEQLVLFRPRTS